LITFLRSQRRYKLLDEGVTANKEAVRLVVLQYEKGAVDFNRYATIEQAFVTQQDSATQAKGQIVEGLIAVYRSLGGGWEIRLGEEETAEPQMQPEPPSVRQEVPAPATAPGKEKDEEIMLPKDSSFPDEPPETLPPEITQPAPSPPKPEKKLPPSP
jgi:hypothetical protein